MQIAKIFINARSWAVRLAEKFRFSETLMIRVRENISNMR